MYQTSNPFGGCYFYSGDVLWGIKIIYYFLED